VGAEMAMTTARHRRAWRERSHVECLIFTASLSEHSITALHYVYRPQSNADIQKPNLSQSSSCTANSVLREKTCSTFTPPWPGSLHPHSKPHPSQQRPFYPSTT
jgi:hypothetical protein